MATSRVDLFDIQKMTMVNNVAEIKSLLDIANHL